MTLILSMGNISDRHSNIRDNGEISNIERNEIEEDIKKNEIQEDPRSGFHHNDRVRDGSTID